MHKTLPLGTTFNKTFLSFSVPICSPILKQLPVSQTYFLFPSQNVISFLIPSLLKTHIILSLNNQELIFVLAFYRLVNINTSDSCLKKFQRTSQDGIKHYSLIVQNLQFLCKRKLVFSNECFQILFYLEMTQLLNKLLLLSLAQCQNSDYQNLERQFQTDISKV